MGTATFAVNKVGVAGNLRLVVGTVTMSNSYAAAGDTLAATALGLREVFWSACEDSTNRVLLRYDRANGKVLAFYPTGGATAAPTTAQGASDPRTTVAVLTAGGTAVTASAATGPFSPALDPGRMKEVGATSDMSTTTGRFMFLGV